MARPGCRAGRAGRPVLVGIRADRRHRHIPGPPPRPAPSRNARHRPPNRRLNLSRHMPMNPKASLLGRWFPRMALRLTGISTPADAAGTPAGVPLPVPGFTESGAAFGNRLGNQARTYLATNDLKATSPCSGMPAITTTPRRATTPGCGWSRRGSPQPASPPRTTQATQRYVAGRRRRDRRARGRSRASRSCSTTPASPCTSCGASTPPTRSSRPRTLLDPALPHLKRNLDELARRRREASQSGRSLKPLHAAVPALASKARAIAKQARPASEPEAQPVHDRQGRGGDAPPLPGRGEAPPSTRS